MIRFRLLFVIAKYFNYGGLQRDFMEIVQRCKLNNCIVEILTGSWEGEKPEDITVHEVDCRSTTNHRSVEKLGNHLQEILLEKSYDCIIGFNKMRGLDLYYAGDPCFAAKFALKKPKILKVIPRYRNYLKFESDVFRQGLKTEILLISPHEKEKFIKYYETEIKRFHVLPPGIDREHFQNKILNENDRGFARQEFGVSPNDFLVLQVGSSFRTKGVDRAIKAIAALPEEIMNKAVLVVVGKGNNAAYIRQARRLGISNKVYFAGVREDVRRLYLSADLLIHPARTENTGTVLLEAMVCGLPVLAMGHCGYAEHVKKASAGLICQEPFLQKRFNLLLHEMLTSPSRNRWKSNAIQYCKNTDLYSLFDKVTEIINLKAKKNRNLS